MDEGWQALYEGLDRAGPALPEADVTATDLHEPFLATAARRVAAAGEGARFRTLHADMAELPFPKASFDLLWCEGAAYILGVPQALAAWRPLLAPGGRLAFSEAVWLTDRPASEARAIFAGYPEMTDVPGTRARIAAAGWRLLGDFVLSRTAWEAYYAPLEARARTLPDSAPVRETREEIDVWRRHGADYGYAFFVAER
jgi:SAM-dependent methyltransferase